MEERREEKCVQGKRPLGRLKRKWEDNITIRP
jgi:hypothetical protein